MSNFVLVSKLANSNVIHEMWQIFESRTSYNLGLKCWKNSPLSPFQCCLKIRVHWLRWYLQHWTEARGKFPRQYVQDCSLLNSSQTQCIITWVRKCKDVTKWRILKWRGWWFRPLARPPCMPCLFKVNVIFSRFLVSNSLLATRTRRWLWSIKIMLNILGS